MSPSLNLDVGLYKGVFVPTDPRVAYVLFVLPFGSHFQAG
jgi:dimethylaniline monooxygenase (N-oxide forming)